MVVNRAKRLFHSSIRISDRKTVYIDPWQVEGAPHDADLILITHDHHDHYSPEDIGKLSHEGTVLVVPSVMEEAVAAGAIGVEPGKRYTICGLLISTVAAYNIGRPFHPEEKHYVGYLLELNGVRYYIAGDTDRIPENETVSCDVALVPVGGKFTMDAAQAAELVNIIRPAITVPTHYGPVTDSFEAPREFAALVDAGITVEIQ